MSRLAVVTPTHHGRLWVHAFLRPTLDRRDVNPRACGLDNASISGLAGFRGAVT